MSAFVDSLHGDEKDGSIVYPLCSQHLHMSSDMTLWGNSMSFPDVFRFILMTLHQGFGPAIVHFYLHLSLRAHDSAQ